MLMRRSRKKGTRKGRAGVFRLGGHTDRRLFGRRSESGFFGVDAAILIAFIIALLASLSIILTAGLQGIFGQIVNGLDFAPLLIHVPGIAGQPLFRETIVSELGVLNDAGQPTGIFTASTVMGELYGKIQVVAFVGLIVAAIVMGITYVSEQFNLVSRGTAFQLLSESGFVLILLFIFPIIYNAAAAAVNGLNQQVILQGIRDGAEVGPRTMVNTAAGATTYFATALDIGAWNLVPGAAIGPVLMTIIQAIGSFMIIFATFLAGVGRLLLIGMLVSAFPLILVIRLIPPLRNIAAQLQGALIGLMVGTVLASFLIRISWGILVSPGFTDNRLMTWALGCGTLAAVSTVLFLMAGAFGSAGRRISAVGGAAAGLGGTMIGMAGGAAIGAGLGGAAGYGKGALTPGASMSDKFAMASRGTLAGAKTGMGGPAAALTKAPFAGREAAVEEAGRQLLMKTERMEGTSVAGAFLEDYSGPAFQGARTRLTPTRRMVEGVMGESYATQLNEGRIPTDQLQRAFAVAKYQPKSRGGVNRAAEVVRKSGLERRDFEGGLKDAYKQVKESKGDEEANLWLGSVFTRASEGRPFRELGEGRIAPPSKAKGKTELERTPESVPFTPEEGFALSSLTGRKTRRKTLKGG